MELNKLEKFYRMHSRFYDLSRPFFLLNRKSALSKLQFNKSDSVLDMACGTGLNIKLLLEKGIDVKKIVGVDYSESMLKIARNKYPNVKFVKADVSSFDVEVFDKPR